MSPGIVVAAPGRPRRSRAALVAGALALLLSAGGVVPAMAADPSPTPDPAATLAPSAPPDASPSPPPAPEPSATPVPTASSEPAPIDVAFDPAFVPAPGPSLDPAMAVVQPEFAMNLYRSRAFVRQYTASWCVAAATMTMANTLRVLRDSTSWIDRTYTRQRQIIRFAKAQDTLRSSDGSDPRGWAAALRRYGGGSTYRERAFTSFDAAVRYAAEQIRATGKPVGILAWHGGHAWVMHGFTATADPAVSDDFAVTSVWVTGPLRGTDPRNGELSADAFAAKWGRYLQRDGYRGWYKKWLLVAP